MAAAVTTGEIGSGRARCWTPPSASGGCASTWTPRSRGRCNARLRAELAEAGMLGCGGAGARGGRAEVAAIAVEAGGASCRSTSGSAAVAVAAGRRGASPRSSPRARSSPPPRGRCAAASTAGAARRRRSRRDRRGPHHRPRPRLRHARARAGPERRRPSLVLAALEQPGVDARAGGRARPAPARSASTRCAARPRASWAIPRGDLAALLVAAESLGSMRAAHAIAVDHARQRHQFGAPIGSFQQVAALLAEGHVAIELAEGLVADAAVAFDDAAVTPWCRSRWRSRTRASTRGRSPRTRSRSSAAAASRGRRSSICTSGARPSTSTRTEAPNGIARGS